MESFVVLLHQLPWVVGDLVGWQTLQRALQHTRLMLSSQTVDILILQKDHHVPRALW